jgi:flagellar hook-basal body complex protein FliE
MSMQSLQSLYGANGQPQSSTPFVDLRSADGQLPFADLIKGLVQQTDHQQIAAEQDVQHLITGETDSIHEVVLTASRADLAFRLMMEIRNRLIASYQEVMRMQV